MALVCYKVKWQLFQDCSQIAMGGCYNPTGHGTTAWRTRPHPFPYLDRHCVRREGWYLSSSGWSGVCGGDGHPSTTVVGGAQSCGEWLVDKGGRVERRGGGRGCDPAIFVHVPPPTSPSPSHNRL